MVRSARLLPVVIVAVLGAAACSSGPEDGIGIAAGGARNDARSISMTGELLDDCQREVAARK
jgi:hypothetical protein